MYSVEIDVALGRKAECELSIGVSYRTDDEQTNQLATLTAHASQLQARLLVALDTLDAQNLSHASEIAALQESYDKLATRARRLEYERNAANEDLAEMTAVLELVIEKGKNKSAL